MNSGKTIFSQLMDFLPSHEFRRCVERYNGNYKLKQFSCWDQFLCMAFAQLTYRESLRDIESMFVFGWFENSITWDFAAVFLAIRWRTRIRCGIGEYMQISPKCGFVSRENSISTTASGIELKQTLP